MSSLYKYDQEVIRILERSERVMGAYEIAGALPTTEQRPVRAVSIYRSLQRLVDAGQVVKVASKNGFCRLPRSTSSSPHALLILCCRHCDRLELVWSELCTKVQKLAQSRAFKVGRAYLECLGLCRHCKPNITSS